MVIIDPAGAARVPACRPRRPWPCGRRTPPWCGTRSRCPPCLSQLDRCLFFFLAGIESFWPALTTDRFLWLAGWLAGSQRLYCVVGDPVAWGARRGFYRRSDVCVGRDVIALAGVLLVDGRSPVVVQNACDRN